MEKQPAEESYIHVDRFRDETRLGNRIFCALRRAGYGSAPTQSPHGATEYRGIDKEKLRKAIETKKKIPGVSKKSLEKAKLLLEENL